MSNSLEANDQPRTPAGRNAFLTLIAPTARRAPITWVASVGVVVVVVFGFAIRGTAFDLAVVQFFNGFHHGAVATITDAIYKYFGPTFAIIGTAVLTVIILVVTRNLRIASTFAVVIAVTWLSMAVVKLLVHRVRPDESVLSYPFNPAQVDASYPSGHAAFVTALVVTVFLAVSIGYRRWLVGILGGRPTPGADRQPVRFRRRPAALRVGFGDLSPAARARRTIAGKPRRLDGEGRTGGDAGGRRHGGRGAPQTASGEARMIRAPEILRTLTPAGWFALGVAAAAVLAVFSSLPA